MTDVNHRRKNRPPVNLRHPGYWSELPEGVSWSSYHNGYSAHGRPKTERRIRTGRTDYLDKSLHGWGQISLFADQVVSAGIGNDFSNGHRGMARAVRGAKKFVRTRIRFQENQATQRLVLQAAQEDPFSPTGDL
jgi:hypothetical protein